MLSTAQPQFSPIAIALSHNLGECQSNLPVTHQYQSLGVETMAHGSQYALEHIQSMSTASRTSAPVMKSPTRLRHHPYEMAQSNRNIHSLQPLQSIQPVLSVYSDSTQDERGEVSAPVRRRISRACDQCNQLRTKCNGRSPCAHCVGKSAPLHCESPFLTESRVWSRL